jgi:hypothetical protein
MCNRKRRIHRPELEGMELRLAPSAITIVAGVHHKAVLAEVRVAHTSNKHVKPSEQKNNEALKSLQQQQHLVDVHSRERTPSALPSKAQQQATEVSNLFKNLEGAL